MLLAQVNNLPCEWTVYIFDASFALCTIFHFSILPNIDSNANENENDTFPHSDNSTHLISIMSALTNHGEAVAAAAPETIKISVKGHQVYEINRQVLIDSSPYFRGMFNGGFMENTTGVVELPDTGDYIEEAFPVLMQFFERGDYSMRVYLAEKKAEQDQLDPPQLSTFWFNPLALALRLHELWLDLFVLVDQYGSKKMSD